MGPLLGGMWIGGSAIALLVLDGRSAGISEIFGRLLGGEQVMLIGAFVFGLLGGPALYALALG